MSDLGRKFARKTLSGIRQASNDYITNKQSKGVGVKNSKRAMIAAMVSGMSEISIDKMLDETNSDASKEEKEHFMDKLLDSMVNRLAAPENELLDLDSEAFFTLGDDNLMGSIASAHKPNQARLSIRKLASNFKRISTKMDKVNSFMNAIMKVFSWNYPSMTLSFLFLYTWACIYPYMFLIYPLMYVCTQLLIESYLDKHPLDYKLTKVIPTRKRGASSIFSFLVFDPEHDLEYKEYPGICMQRQHSYLKEMGVFVVSNGLFSPVSSSISSSTSSEIDENIERLSSAESEPLGPGLLETPPLYTVYQDDDKTDYSEGRSYNEDFNRDVSSQKPVKSPKHEKLINKINLMNNMRDCQNMSAKFIEGIERFESMVDEYCSFKDEKKSTIFFFQLTLIVVSVCVFGPYIPWRLIFIVSVWVGLLSAHPKRSKILLRLFPVSMSTSIVHKKSSFADEVPNSRPMAPACENVAPILPPRPTDFIPREIASKPKTFEQIGQDLFSRNAIIIDETLKYENAQIFEIQKQDIIDPKKYQPYLYSNSCFTLASTRRAQKKKPRGTTTLNAVKSPMMGWGFVSGEDWKFDTDAKKWCEELGMGKEVYLSSDGWVYDINGEFRRRRLLRKVFKNGK